MIILLEYFTIFVQSLLLLLLLLYSLQKWIGV